MPVEFSVVIPTFRRPTQLRQAATSVLAQRDVSVELFIVDDSPEASAREVAESLNDSRVTYIVNPRPTGGVPSLVRNLGLWRAKGKFLHFLDDDDIVPDGHYSTVRQAFADHPDVGMVFGRIEPFGDCSPEQLEQERRYFSNGVRTSAACQRFGRRWGFVAEMLFGTVMLVCSAAVVRRECAVAVKGFDPAIRLMEDADYNIRIMREFGVCFIDRTVLNYRIGSPSLMHDPNPDPAHAAQVREGCIKFRNKYRAERGAIEFYGLALLSRVVLKLMA